MNSIFAWADKQPKYVNICWVTVNSLSPHPIFLQPGKSFTPVLVRGKFPNFFNVGKEEHVCTDSQGVPTLELTLPAYLQPVHPYLLKSGKIPAFLEWKPYSRVSANITRCDYQGSGIVMRPLFFTCTKRDKWGCFQDKLITATSGSWTDMFIKFNTSDLPERLRSMELR